MASAQNNAITFDGSSQYVTVPYQPGLDLNSNLTLEAWLYPTGAGSDPTEGGIIVNKENSYELARFANGTIQFAFSANGAGTDWSWTNTGIVAPLNTWSHIALVKSGSTVTVYLNGVPTFSSGGNAATLTANAQGLRLANRLNSTRIFAGTLEEIRIWNTARTQAEVKANVFNQSLSNSAAGLVAYYRMNESSGTTTANSSANVTGIDGTLVNAPARTASPVQFATASVNFDGIDDNISIPAATSLNITAAITLEAWVYPTKNAGVQNVISKSSNTQNNGYIFPRTDDGWAHAVAYLHIAGGWRTISAVYPALNAWHHLAVTYDGATIKLYIDGVLANSMAMTGSITTNTNPLTLGNQPGYSEYFGGSADEMRIWNVARTQAQIQAAMNMEIDPTVQTGLVSYYTADQGNIGGNNAGLITAMDKVGNNNGTLTNFALSGATSNMAGQFSGLSALPVSWLAFTAQQKDNTVSLNWTTAEAINNLEFRIQRSSTGSSWNNIGSTAAAANSAGSQSYVFTDANPAAGLNYYRIAQVDRDGKTMYSKTIRLLFSSSRRMVRVYPNPVSNGQLNIQLREPAQVSLFNSNGTLIFSRKMNAGTGVISLGALAKGWYQLKAGDETLPVIIQ